MKMSQISCVISYRSINQNIMRKFNIDGNIDGDRNHLFYEILIGVSHVLICTWGYDTDDDIV